MECMGLLAPVKNCGTCGNDCAAGQNCLMGMCQ
jgi:hypothetical protein